MLVHDHAPFTLHARTGGTTMLIEVPQQRQAERDDVFGRTAGARPIVQRSQDLVDAALEQIVLVAIMGVERRAADIGAVEDLLHGD
jgi:hypothetical protein